MSDKINEKKIRAHERATIQELLSENSATDKPTESKQLSEVRKHVRNAINEIMVGLTPITRIDNAEKAKKGNNTNSAVDKADIGFNTFDIQEWASIAGIDEKHLNESITDDTGDDTMLGGDDSAQSQDIGAEIRNRQPLRGEAVDEEPSELPENLMTVASMKKILEDFPDEMPVAYWHEFGVMNVTDVEVSYNDRFYKKVSYGGDWHDDEVDDASDARLYKILIIG